MSWTKDAACTEYHGDLWYPDAASDPAHAAKWICNNTCNVREACLKKALETEEPYGVWGGLGPYERAKLLNRHRCRRCTTTLIPKGHTYCPPCRDEARRESKARSATRKANQ